MPRGYDKDRFVPNPAFEGELLRSTILLNPLKDAAEDIAEHVKAVAPVEDGDYRDGIEGVAGMTSSGATGRVNANDWKSVFIEFGTSEHAFGAPMHRGVEAAGYTLKGDEE